MPVPAQAAPLVVNSLNFAKKHKRLFDAVITIEDPRALQKERLRFTQKPHLPHLVLRFEDVDEPDDRVRAAVAEDVEKVLTFAREYANSNLLVHCHAGISRSTAMTYAVLADRYGPGREADAFTELLRLRPEAVPNLHVSRLADDVLGRHGAFVAQVFAHECLDAEALRVRNRRREMFLKQPHLYSFW